MALMVVFGCVFMVAGILYLILKLQVSYDTEGGVHGMVPIHDASLFAPLFIWFGLGVIQRASGWPGWPWWGFVLGWLMSVVVAGWLLYRVGERGRRYHER